MIEKQENIKDGKSKPIRPLSSFTPRQLKPFKKLSVPRMLFDHSENVKMIVVLLISSFGMILLKLDSHCSYFNSGFINLDLRNHRI